MTLDDILDLSRWDADLPTTAQLEALGLVDRLRFDSPGLFDPASFSRVFALRERFVGEFSFALPSQDVLDAIAARSTRIVEVGAGSGFWARLMAQRGFDIVATNAAEGHDYAQTLGRHHRVEGLDARAAILAYPDRDVLCVWPSYDQDWIRKAILDMKPGRYLFYVGEWHGCTADAEFHDLLDDRDEFEPVGEGAMANFPGIHDHLFILRRKARS